MRIYVGNLSYEATDVDLRATFEDFGAVESVTIIKDKFSGKSKGFGFVEMPSDEEAQSAIEALNGQDFKGRKMNVNEARPPKSDNRGDRGGKRNGRGGPRGSKRSGERGERSEKRRGGLRY